MSARRPMTDKEKQFFNAFKLAIENERGAQGHYGKMAAMAEDPESRGLFEGLQREEAEHEEKLLQLYGEYKARFVSE
jgi:rubrerythrin